MSVPKTNRDKPPRYESILLSELRQGRLGKHHELMENILRQLQALPEGEAIKIPLDGVDGLPKANLRSAIMRAAGSHEMHVSTYSDSNCLYVWNRTKRTAQYERTRKRFKDES
jgi:hypothetical protein